MAEEKAIYNLRPSWLNWFLLISIAVFFILAGILSIISHGFAGMYYKLFILGTFIFGYVWIKIITYKFTITDQRVIAKKGIISNRTSEVEIKDIRNLEVSQGLLQRLFFIGNVGISSAGTSGLEVIFKGIKDPEKIKDIIRKLRPQ